MRYWDALAVIDKRALAQEAYVRHVCLAMNDAFQSISSTQVRASVHVAATLHRFDSWCRSMCNVFSTSSSSRPCHLERDERVIQVTRSERLHVLRMRSCMAEGWMLR